MVGNSGAKFIGVQDVLNSEMLVNQRGDIGCLPLQGLPFDVR